MSLTPRNVALLEQTWSEMSKLGFKEVGLAILIKLFNDAHEVRSLFTFLPATKDDYCMEVLESNNMVVKHAISVASAIDKIIELLHNSNELVAYLKELGEVHKVYNVDKKHFDTMALVLLTVIKNVLGSRATDEVMESWTKAYGAIKAGITSVM